MDDGQREYSPSGAVSTQDSVLRTPYSVLRTRWPTIVFAQTDPDPRISAPVSSFDGMRLAVALWLIILTVITVRVTIWPRVHSNFPILAAAAQDWLHGDNLYFLETVRRHGLDHYRYSPLVAALLVPFGVLPEWLGGVLWRLVNAGVFLAGLAWWLRAAAPVALGRAQQAALFVLVVPLALSSLNNGQSNLLLIGLILAGLAAAANERWNVAAGSIALASLVKLYPLAIGLLLVLLYPRKFAGRLAAALALGFLLPFALQAPDYVADQYATWLHLLGGDDRRAWPLAIGYQDLWLLVRLWHLPLGHAGYLAVQLGTAALIALLCLAGRWAAQPERRLLLGVLTFGTCWMTLLGPATESSTYALLAPALAWTVLETWTTDRPRLLRGLAAASLGLVLVAGVAGWLPWRAEVRSWGVYPLAALTLVACLVGLQVHDWRRTPLGQAHDT